jgi:hypothetical protein
MPIVSRTFVLIFTSHTQTGGAQAQFIFNGSAVAVYGTVSPEHASYTVMVDGDTRGYLGGSDGLANGLHTGVRTPAAPCGVR